jgi:hypothetical protein
MWWHWKRQVCFVLEDARGVFLDPDGVSGRGVEWLAKQSVSRLASGGSALMWGRPVMGVAAAIQP